MAGDKDSLAMLALLLDLARLSDTLAILRDGQNRFHQAEAARAAAAILRMAAEDGGRLGPVSPPLPDDLTAELPIPHQQPHLSATTPSQSSKDGHEQRPGR